MTEKERKLLIEIGYGVLKILGYVAPFGIKSREPLERALDDITGENI